MPKAGITYSKNKVESTDYTELNEREEREVKDELGAIARPDDRIERAAEIIRQADAEIALHQEDRDKAVASLWFYGHVLGLSRAINVTNTAYREILSKALYGIDRRRTGSGHFELRPVPNVSNEELEELAKQAGVERIDSALEDLPRLAQIVAKARVRRKTAVVFMREAALVLSEEPYGWDGERIATHAGVSTKLIWQQQATARRDRDKARKAAAS
ncbi:hypothetical protein ACFT38_28285 [Streptomyces sp. NPDC056975]|uniref:hypothetical protein n=1 Tax=Streptomyces sp. NPDC056975 TaxID=3345985 RepID=UPI0036352969